VIAEFSFGGLRDRSVGRVQYNVLAGMH